MFRYLKDLLYTLRQIESSLSKIAHCVSKDGVAGRKINIETGLSAILSRRYGGR